MNQERQNTVAGRLIALVGRLHASYRDSIATLLLRLVSLAIAFVASILFARSIGPAGYGDYATVIAWTTLLIIPAALGLPEYFLRELAGATVTELRHAVRWADYRILLAGAATGLLATIVWKFTAGTADSLTFVIAAPIPVLAALTLVRQSALRQVGIVASAVWPQAVMLPALILVLAGMAWLSTGLSVLALLAATTAAHAASLLVTELKVRHVFRTFPRTPRLGHADYRIRAALPFIGLAGLALLNTRVDILVLSGLSSSSETGVYSVATRISDVLLLPITVVNMVVSPTVAKLHRSGNRSELQTLLKQSSRFSLLLTGVPAVGLIAFASPIITTCFGAAYSGAANPLRILAVAQIINASAGGVGMALSMTGHERSALRVGIMAAVLNLSLNLILVPLAGGIGAAIGTAISLVAWRAGFYWLVRRHLGIRPTAFGA